MRACDDGTGPLKVGNLWQALRARCAARAWFRRDTLSAAFLTVWRARAAPRRMRTCLRALVIRAGYSQRRESDLDQLEALLWISYEMGTVVLPHTYS